MCVSLKCTFIFLIIEVLFFVVVVGGGDVLLFSTGGRRQHNTLLESYTRICFVSCISFIGYMDYWKHTVNCPELKPLPSRPFLCVVVSVLSVSTTLRDNYYTKYIICFPVMKHFSCTLLWQLSLTIPVLGVTEFLIV